MNAKFISACKTILLQNYCRWMVTSAKFEQRQFILSEMIKFRKVLPTFIFILLHLSAQCKILP